MERSYQNKHFKQIVFAFIILAGFSCNRSREKICREEGGENLNLNKLLLHEKCNDYLKAHTFSNEHLLGYIMLEEFSMNQGVYYIGYDYNRSLLFNENYVLLDTVVCKGDIVFPVYVKSYNLFREDTVRSNVIRAKCLYKPDRYLNQPNAWKITMNENNRLISIDSSMSSVGHMRLVKKSEEDSLLKKLAK